MSFHKNFRIAFVPAPVAPVVEPFEVFRDKETGSVTAVIRGGAVSTQRADIAARSMFVSPVRLVGKERAGDVETRHYMAQNYLTTTKI